MGNFYFLAWVWNKNLLSSLIKIVGCFGFLGCISELRNVHQSSQLPVTDDETILHKFCVKLETVLRHEQKGMCLKVLDADLYFCCLLCFVFKILINKLSFKSS